ncbi:protein arginine N-methyltransferase 9-like [Actinia tenebrosa]|uniref:Protein arginine N-methyltransferase 9-like n=1 Tax=Actinia tenebrosa TaxID=6105 RepID=A0A6P8IYX1_ACTTE|nr:protein arginine N-methyltransferase 9-like [Actinia tenebrosa]
MNEKEEDEVSKYLSVARECIVLEKYAEALAYFVCLGNMQPARKKEFESDFMAALCKWTEVLEQHGDYKKMLNCFQEAAVLYPDNETLLNNVGGVLFRLGFSDESASFFRKALRLNPSNLQARENLENVSNSLVERWHFRMLNDRKRNLAYKEAIKRAIARGYDTVLDIGSGTGILSMFAVEEGAKKVYACELSKTMYEVSIDVLRANQMLDSIHLINKKSTEMSVGKDLPSHVTLVVTETMDCGLLGEGILKTISHAWGNLLVPLKDSMKSSQPASKVIPSGAVLYGMVITARDIRKQSRCRTMISGVDLSKVHIIGGDQLEPQNNNSDLVIEDPVEPYTTESLNTLPSGYKPLTDTFVITEYNFCDTSSLDAKRELTLEVSVKCSGNVDAIAVWFDLHLDENVCISTGPSDDSLCWEQAIFPVHPHHLVNKSSHEVDNEILINVNEGDSLTITGVVSQEYLQIQCRDASPKKNIGRELLVPTAPYGCQENVNQDQDVTAVPVLAKEVKNDCKKSSLKAESLVVLPPSYLCRANDTFYSSSLQSVVLNSFKEINLSEAQADGGVCGIKVLDNMNGLPLCSLLAVQEGASHVLITNPGISINVLEEIRKSNEIPNRIHYGPAKLEDIALDGRNWDIFITDLVEPSGALKQQAIEDIVFSQGCLLKQDSGLVIPREFQALSMCIESQALMALSKVVNNENTLGLEIGQFMNEFQVSTQVNIDLSTLEFTALSEELELFDMDFMRDISHDEELLELLEVKKEKKVKMLREGIYSS